MYLQRCIITVMPPRHFQLFARANDKEHMKVPIIIGIHRGIMDRLLQRTSNAERNFISLRHLVESGMIFAYMDAWPGIKQMHDVRQYLLSVLRIFVSLPRLPEMGLPSSDGNKCSIDWYSATCLLNNFTPGQANAYETHITRRENGYYDVNCNWRIQPFSLIYRLIPSMTIFIYITTYSSLISRQAFVITKILNVTLNIDKLQT